MSFFPPPESAKAIRTMLVRRTQFDAPLQHKSRQFGQLARSQLIEKSPNLNYLPHPRQRTSRSATELGSGNLTIPCSPTVNFTKPGQHSKITVGNLFRKFVFTSP